jgi:hypothetical protein
LELLPLALVAFPLELHPLALVAFLIEVSASLVVGQGGVAWVLQLLLVVAHLVVALVFLGLELVLAFIVWDHLSCSYLLGCTCFATWVEQARGDGSRVRTLLVC